MNDTAKTDDLYEKWEKRMKELNDLFGGIDEGSGGAAAPASPPLEHEPENGP